MQYAGIVWLASYHKSGNTWLRSFLDAYLKPDVPLNLDALESPISASRSLLDEILGIETADLTASEIRELLPDAYRAWAALPQAPRLVKTHDAFTHTALREPVFPPEVTRGAVHLIRDPRDVAVSLAHHYGCSLDDAIMQLNDPTYWIAKGKREVKGQIPQFLSDWSRHTLSWLEAPVARLTMRYEDMLADPLACFTRVVDYCGLSVDERRLAHAVDATRFTRLQSQEAERGFRERPASASAPFFRTGRAGGWRKVLTPRQVDCIVSAHAEMMQRFGYEP